MTNNPTPTEKYTAVREAIVKACPEVMELDEVEWEFVNHGNYIEEADLDSQRLICSFSNKNEPYAHRMGEYICSLHNNRILGSKIGIAEVLRWLGKKDAHYILELDSNGEAELVRLRWEGDRADRESLCRWNLEQDDLEHQSPETIDLLYSLLA